MPTMVEASLRAEALLDRRFAAGAIFHPHTALRLNARPQVDQDAKAFFAWLDRHQSDILGMTEYDAILRIARYPMRVNESDTGWKDRRRDFDRFLAAAYDRNTFVDLQSVETELTTIRTVRKVVSWLDNFLAAEVADGAIAQ